MPDAFVISLTQSTKSMTEYERKGPRERSASGDYEVLVLCIQRISESLMKMLSVGF